MPSGPLFYPPLVDAYAKSVPVGDVPAVDRAAAQVNFAVAPKEPGGEKQLAPLTKAAEALVGAKDGAAAVLTTIGGLDKLHSSRAGAAAIQLFKLAEDDAGYVANRTVTLVDSHKEDFEYSDLEQASAQGKDFARQALGELQSNVNARFSGNTLDLGPKLAATLRKSWKGEAIAAEEAMLFGVNVARELERAVTPLPPDKAHRVLQWVEDGTVDLLSVWPGHLGATVAAAGIKTDPKAFAKLEPEVRAAVLGGQNADSNRALAGVLGLAGVDANKADQREQAAKLLQEVPLEQVPVSLAKGIIEHRKLPADKLEWLAGRIVDLGGRPGNVGGLAAELAAMG